MSFIFKAGIKSNQKVVDSSHTMDATIVQWAWLSKSDIIVTCRVDVGETVDKIFSHLACMEPSSTVESISRDEGSQKYHLDFSMFSGSNK